MAGKSASRKKKSHQRGGNLLSTIAQTALPLISQLFGGGRTAHVHHTHAHVVRRKK